MASPAEEIKSRLDIVELVQSYIRLQKAGANYKGLCPFHSEKTPSFNVSPARQIWHCFGCGLGGDHFAFVMQIEGIEFPDALELLAKRAGVTIHREDPRLRSERTRLYEISEAAATLFEQTLRTSANPDVRISPVRAYLRQRGMTDETIKHWRIGYAPDSWDHLTRALGAKGYRPAEIAQAGLAIHSERGSFYDRFRNRIIFPITDFNGRVIGFGGRIFEGAERQKTKDESDSEKQPQAKYINTPQTLIYDKSRTLFGFHHAKENIRHNDAVVIVEGYMDCMMSHQAGITHAVAVSGTALTSHQLKTLRRLAGTMISSFDRDAAGEAATKRSMDLAAVHGFERKAAVLPSGLKDPADAVLKNPAIWQQAVNAAKPLVEFFLETALARGDATTASGKRTIAAAVLPEIKILSSEIEKSHWMQALARSLEIGEESLWRELEKTRPMEQGDPNETSEKNAVAPDRRSQLESLLVGAFILSPEQARAHLADVPQHAILNPQHRNILGIFEKTPAERSTTSDAFIAILPEELRTHARHIAFQAEIILQRIENDAERKREIAWAAQELGREWTRARLKELATEISRAEAKGEGAQVSSLLKEFRTLSEHMR